jgi:hypothetical protein
MAAGYAALSFFLGFFSRFCLPLSGLAITAIRPVAARVARRRIQMGVA